MHHVFIIDPLNRLDPTHDTSVALMEAACTLGHRVWVTAMESLSLVGGEVWAWLHPVTVFPLTLNAGHWQVQSPWYKQDEGTFQPLAPMQTVWMRPDPPVTSNYLFATYLLDYLDPKTTRVINSPKGLRAANEKAYAMQFRDLIPETIITARREQIGDFVQGHGCAVMKPLDGKGGEGILMLRPDDPNLNSLIELSTHRGTTPVMVQEFLPAIKDGDKRVLLFEGRPLGAINRVPKSGEFRGNMAAGGSAVAAPITPQDRKICDRLAPTLLADGLYFVGIDIIGGYLTEVNVTSPTGIREMDRFDGGRLGERIMEQLSP
ncbi:MAG: glutathione synthase [Oscillatoriales cyanobacterium SM2_2_1]|nr:glutathione synthase [Oscillatoriales cyanobacterium SM2_2_1]